MVVVPPSQLELCRQRKRMSTALEQRDWAAVKRLDSALVEGVASAAGDPERDLSTLLNEMRLVVALYRNLLQNCDDSAREVVERLLK